MMHHDNLRQSIPSGSNNRQRKWCFWLAIVMTLLPNVLSSDSLNRYSVDYYKDPKLEWMIRLEGQELFEGNGVVQSPFHDKILYVTSRKGVLFAISSLDGSVIQVVTPEARTYSQEGTTQTYDMHCFSSVAFGELSTGKQFLVYSIVDQPSVEELSSTGPKTRVVAVSIPENEILWSSAGLPGIANGSPVVYVNQWDSKNYVVLTHNSKLVKPDNSTLTTGHATVLRMDKGHLLWTESEWSRDEIPRGYSPPGGVNQPLFGKYDGGLSNRNYLVAWTSSEDGGRGQLGYTYALQFPRSFAETSHQVDSLKSILLKKVRWNAVTRPVLNKNGTHMFVGVTGSELRGWVDDTRFDETASWAIDLVHTTIDPLAAIPAAPTLSNDEKRLFVASASSDMACISTQTGLEIWHMSGTSPFLAETRTAPDNSRVYVIQSADGRIFSQDQLTGKLEWVGSCDSFQEDCANSVRAHFDLSKAGEYMYYGDVMGRIIALKLGDLVDNSGSTSGPGTSGTIDWDAHSQNEEKSKSGSNFGGSIALIILAVLVAIGSTAYVMMVNAFKTVPHPQQEPQPEETIETSGRNDDDFALPIDSANAPDPYEDSMISQHTNSSTPTARDVTAFTWNDRNRPKTLLDDSSDNASHASSHAPADRISKLLGTTNRITPIKEDFSYGASVLV